MRGRGARPGPVRTTPALVCLRSRLTCGIRAILRVSVLTITHDDVPVPRTSLVCASTIVHSRTAPTLPLTFQYVITSTQSPHRG